MASAHLNSQERFVYQMFKGMFYRFIKVEYNCSVLSSPDPIIFAANHNNYFETVLLALLLLSERQGRKVSFISDWMFQYLPITGFLLNISDPIYVYNKRARILLLNRLQKDPVKYSVLKTCARKLETGVSIGIYPKGTRSQDPLYLKPGKRGIGKLVLETQVPVIPIGIDFP